MEAVEAESVESKVVEAEVDTQYTVNEKAPDIEIEEVNSPEANDF